MKICVVEGCDRPHHARGYCGPCYTKYVSRATREQKTQRAARLRQRYQNDPKYRARTGVINKRGHAKRRDEVNAERRKRYAEDSEYRAKQRQFWRTPEQRDSASEGAKRRQRYRELRAKALEGLGSSDACTFCDSTRHLEIDHKNGNGIEHRKHTGSLGIMQHVIDHPEEYQVLCASCNRKKGSKVA